MTEDDEDWEYQTCDECGWFWKITYFWRTYFTVRLCLYSAQPWMNHVHIRCSKCGYHWRIFGLKRGVYRRLRKHGARPMMQRFAPDYVGADFEKFFGIKAVKPRKLTPRQERIVEQYRRQLGEEDRP